ncbi:hypothetical protein ACFWAN_13450 [Streptomyces mirabilis]|uniref:hypothetical protein n=1 Tax=Streptomyces mirabilis TaxID=68239 RepID=UPI0036489E48
MRVGQRRGQLPKKVNGRKRYLIWDDSLVLLVMVIAADVTDCDAAKERCSTSR